MTGAVAACVLLVLGGCDDASRRDTNTGGDASEPLRTVVAAPAPPSHDESAPTVVFLGDSLTAGYGLDENQAFPALVAEALAAEATSVRVVNAGVSGDTTAGGLARLDWILKQAPDVLVVGLGGNDGLRGLDVEMTEANLGQIIERAKRAGAVVVLLGLRMPPNYGPDYTEQFAAIYPKLAETHEAILVPFLLEGVGGEPRLNLADGIHPNSEGQAILARTVLPYVREALDSSEQ